MKDDENSLIAGPPGDITRPSERTALLRTEADSARSSDLEHAVAHPSNRGRPLAMKTEHLRTRACDFRTTRNHLGEPTLT